jgi:hypothetical protein
MELISGGDYFGWFPGFFANDQAGYLKHIWSMFVKRANQWGAVLGGV